MALMGKAGAGEGDTLDDPTATFAYDLERFRAHRRAERGARPRPRAARTGQPALAGHIQLLGRLGQRGAAQGEGGAGARA